MTKTKRPHINLIALLFVTIAFGFVIQYYGSQEQPTPVQQAKKDRPDFFMNKASSRIMDEQGKVRYHLSAKSIFHNPKLNESHLIEPKIITNDKNKRVWHITAEKGVLPDHKKHATLSKNVVTTKLLNDATKKNAAKVGTKELVANSDQITYNAENQTVTSQGNVKVTTKSHLITGNSMVVDIPADKMEITTNVKTSIKPQD